MNNKPSVAPTATNPFAAKFAAASLQSLINTFNSQVGLRAWTSQRAQHDDALIAELQHRGIDVSAVHDGTSTSFAHHVALSPDEKFLIEFPTPCARLCRSTFSVEKGQSQSASSPWHRPGY